MYVYIHMVDIQCTGIYKCIYRNVHQMLGLKLYICIYIQMYISKQSMYYPNIRSC